MGRSASSWNPTPGWHGPIHVSFASMKKNMLVRRRNRHNFLNFDLFLGKVKIKSETNQNDAPVPSDRIAANCINRFFELAGAKRYEAELRGPTIYIRDLIRRTRRPVTDEGIVLTMPAHSAFRILSRQFGTSYEISNWFGEWIYSYDSDRQNATGAVEPQL